MASESRAVSQVNCPASYRALQRAILAFFSSMIVVLLVLYLLAPSIYVETLMLDRATTAHESHPLAITVFLCAIVAFVTMGSIGVMRRWRWVFWLAMFAFLASLLEIPAGILQLLDVLPIDQPAWYVILRMAISVVEFALGLWMLRVWRTCGVW